MKNAHKFALPASPAGVECEARVEPVSAPVESPREVVTRADASPPPATAIGPTIGPSAEGAGGDVDAALAKALEQAAAAGRFDVVALLAGELQARRLAREGVVTLDAKKRQRGA
jgi:hypothetical protein